MKKNDKKYLFSIFRWLLRPRDYQNLFRHVENPPHANYELIWFRESPVFDIFTSGVRGVSPEVRTFSGSTLKRLKWFFEAAFEPRDYQNIDLHVAEHHLDRLLYGFVHYESRFCHFTETWGSYPANDFLKLLLSLGIITILIFMSWRIIWTSYYMLSFIMSRDFVILLNSKHGAF